MEASAAPSPSPPPNEAEVVDEMDMQAVLMPQNAVTFQLNVRDVPYHVPVQLRVVFDHTDENANIDTDDVMDFYLIARNQIMIFNEEPGVDPPDLVPPPEIILGYPLTPESSPPPSPPPPNPPGMESPSSPHTPEPFSLNEI
ncbi:uncharacterized protein LOC126749094 [Anthonomus grandis grandis]|uniref:uncharacterized protein LOC126749094 n=1 Tax=Anthonomus grandis grandis TaxID=2921223 RepID=UPI002165FC59|nr:uncharacterized protein LOC126749094 [Anthonomus grandis grandis]